MRTKSAVKPLLFSVAALALSACSDQRQEPAPKTAVSTETRNLAQASDRFTDLLDRSAFPDTRATLYPELVDQNAALADSRNLVIRRSADYEWLALIDHKPGAYFSHPVSLAFLPYSQPQISLLETNSIPQLLETPLWLSSKQLLNSTNVLYSDCWIDRPPTRSLIDIENLTALSWQPRMAEDHCRNQKRAYALLIHNLVDLEASPETLENLEMMAASLGSLGYNVLEFADAYSRSETKPYVTLSARNGNGLYQLKNFVSAHYDFNDCCEEIIVYLTGETTLDEDTYHTLVSFDLPFAYRGESTRRDPDRSFFAEDLAAILDPLKSCHLNLIVDANHAAGFVEPLFEIPNTESVLASCQENEYTYSSCVDSLAQGAFTDPFSTLGGERGSEFTSSIAKAFFELAKTRESKAPPPAAHFLNEVAFEAVKKYDLAFLAGQSEPSLIGRTQNSDCSCGIDHAGKKL